MKNRKNGKTLNAGYPLIEGRKSGVLAAICISAVVSYAAYIVFFHYSAFIWSLNFRLYPIDTYYVEWSKSFLNEHDGIELYVLYIMTFIDVLFSFILIKILDRIRDIRNYYFIFLIFLVESIVYFRTIGFSPPRNTIAGFSHYDPVFFLMIVLIPLVLCFLSGINERLKNITDILVTLLLIPVCFVPVMRYIIFDYGYILEPAVKIIKGIPLKEIYFQYDALISIIAAALMKTGINFNYFQVIGMSSLYLFYLGTYFFGRHIFYDKKMPVFLVFSMVLLCFYDVQNLAQMTPLRLDLWFGAFILAYFYGISSMFLAFYLGFLLIFSKSFGMIYLLAYLETVFILFAAGLIEKASEKGWSAGLFLTGIRDCLKLYYKNAVIIAAAYCVNVVIFGKAGLESAGAFVTVGIGFLPILRSSFFWYIPVILSLLTYALFEIKKSVTGKYFNAIVFLIILTVGNSLYFFGRSYENNLLNIARIYLWVLFVLLDVVLIYLRERHKPGKQTKYIDLAAWVVPALFISLVAVYYSGEIKHKVVLQLATLKNHKVMYSYDKDSVDIAAVKELTGNSEKVYFLTHQNDFLYYYYGRYDPLGYFSPFTAWLYKKDLAVFLNGLLSKGYYLVADDEKSLVNLFDSLIFDTRKEKNSMICIYRKRH